MEGGKEKEEKRRRKQEVGKEKEEKRRWKRRKGVKRSDFSYIQRYLLGIFQELRQARYELKVSSSLSSAFHLPTRSLLLASPPDLLPPPLFLAYTLSLPFHLPLYLYYLSR
jgi:hypothetical protein